MKMPLPMFNQLKADMALLLREKYHVLCPVDQLARTSIYTVFHEVNAQRSFADDHPRWRTQPRLLEPSHVDGQTWINSVYAAGLQDDHIDTALSRIVRELGAEQRAQSTAQPEGTTP
jgi:hypothetical protein